MSPIEHQLLIDKYKIMNSKKLLEEVLYLRGIVAVDKYNMNANEMSDSIQDTYFVAYTELKCRIDNCDTKRDWL